MKKRVKINGIIIVLSVLIIAAFPKVFLRSGREDNFINESFEILGITGILIGQMIRVSARGFKSVHSQDGHALVQAGPYALVRNPMYLGIFFITMGTVMMLFNWWIVSILVVVFGSQYALLMLKEERTLEKQFPEQYQEYCARVPRIVPSLRKMVSTDIAEYLPLKLSWLKKEFPSIGGLLFFVLFIESWKDITTEGIKVYLRESRAIPVVLVLFFLFVFWLSKRTGQLQKNGTGKSKDCV